MYAMIALEACRSSRIARWKKPSIASAWMSSVITRSAPAVSRRFATSRAVIGSRAFLRSCREYGNCGMTAVMQSGSDW